MRKLAYFLIALPLVAQEPAKTDAPKPAEAKQEAPAEPAPAAENWLTGSVEVGYRFMTDVGGDFNTYRSVVNLGEGPKLFNADFTIQPLTPSRYVDRIDVHAASWGGDPYNTFRLDAKKTGLYRLRFDYRNIAFFNFMPSFANPGDGNAALPFINQRGFDTHRRMTNVELELFPGKRIIPYVAFSRNGGRGSGTTNFVQNANEYTVPSRYSDHTNDVRGGVRFEFNRWHATLEGGHLNFRDDQEVWQASPVPNTGNRTSPYLGEDLTLDGGRQKYGVRGGAPFLRALFSASPVTWADVTAQFLYSQPHSDIHYTQNSTGTLFDFNSVAFYNSELLEATGSSTRPNPSGNVNLMLHPFGGRVRILESWMTNRMHTAGTIALLDQFLSTGVAPTMSELANAARFVANYNQQETNILFDVNRWLTVRGGQRYVWGDTTAPPSILVEGAGFDQERGELKRHVGMAGVTVRAPSDVRVTFDFEGSPGDRAYFRTSLNDYKKARVLAKWKPVSTLELTGHVDVLKNENPDPVVRYDFLSRNTTLTAYWTPGLWKGLGILADYSRSTLKTNTNYVIPSEFTTARFNYWDNAHTGSLLADLPIPGGAHAPKLSLGGSFFRSAGTAPARYWQPMARLAIPVMPHVQFNTEWRWYALTQPYLMYEGFRSHQFVTSLRFTR